MKQPWMTLLVMVCLVFPLSATDIMKLGDVRPGMEGIAKTIFKGSEIETFRFRVLGFYEKYAPHRDLIWVELLSPQLEGGGVISGMSGSPAYIDGKLIGAVAYGFGFSKQPIAGVTPIEDIIETSSYNDAGYTIDIGTIKLEFDRENVARLAKFFRRKLMNRLNGGVASDIVPLKLISANRGIHPRALDYLEPLFAPSFSMDSTPQIKKTVADENLFKLSPADAATIPLIRGDFEYKVSGTVTHVDGKNVYLFGHPFFNLGRVEFPLHRGEVISVVPSYDSSFRLTSSRQMIGTVVQDRFAAVQAELGTVPYMIPLHIFLKNRNSTFDIEMVNHPLLTPALSAISLSNVFYSEYQAFGFNSIRVRGRIFVDGEKNILIDDLYSGTDAFNEFSNLLLVINYFLMNNREKAVKIQKMDFEISGSETVRRATIQNVVLDSFEFSPGDPMNVKLFLLNERGSGFTETVTLKAPNLKPGESFFLMVADSNEIMQFDAKNIKSSYFPVKVSALIRAINNLRKNNRIYFKLMTPVEGLFIKGYEYSNLPRSLRDLFDYNSTSEALGEMRYSTIMEYQMEVPAVVEGKKLFKLKMKER